MSDHLTDEVLSRLIDGDLPLSAREAALAHLRQCAACSTRQDSLVVVAATLRQFPPAEVTGSRIERIVDSLDEPATISRHWPTAAMALASFSACALAVATLAAVPVAAVAVLTAFAGHALPPQLHLASPERHLLLAALVVAIGAPLAAYPLARWR